MELGWVVVEGGDFKVLQARYSQCESNARTVKKKKEWVHHLMYLDDQLTGKHRKG